MIKMWKILIFFVLLVLISCATQKKEGAQHVPDNLYDLNISYSHKEKAFLFSFTSHADGEICIPRMSWVDETGGHYFFEDKRIYFIDRGVRYDIKDLASGYCTPQRNNGCVHVLKKNDHLFGKLRIEDFAVSSEIYLNKDFNPKLQYPYKPRFCAAR
jgi:hypothetical protein